MSVPVPKQVIKAHKPDDIDGRFRPMSGKLNGFCIFKGNFLYFGYVFLDSWPSLHFTMTERSLNGLLNE